jgi:hypothetical protein
VKFARVQHAADISQFLVLLMLYGQLLVLLLL